MSIKAIYILWLVVMMVMQQQVFTPCSFAFARPLQLNNGDPSSQLRLAKRRLRDGGVEGPGFNRGDSAEVPPPDYRR